MRQFAVRTDSWSIAIAIALAMLTAGCGGGGAVDADALSGRADIETAALAMSADLDDRFSIDHGRRILKAMASDLEDVLRDTPTPEARIARMANWLFNTKNLYSWVPKEDRWRGSTLGQVIDYHRGDCVALSLLYLSLADRLDLPLRLVTMPGHALVAWVDGDGSARFYIETTRSEPVRPSLAYLDDRLGTERTGQRGAFHGRALSKREAVGVAMQQWGVGLMEQGRHREAEARFERAIAINPDDASNHYHLARLMEKTGRLAKAEAQFARAAQKNPRFADAFVRRAIVLMELDRYAHAADSAQSAVALAPDDPSLRLLYARLLTRAGRPEEAEVQLREAQRLADELKARIDAMRGE